MTWSTAPPLPDWVLLENADDGGDDSALDVLLCTLAEKGYDAQAFKVNATDYGLPQSRTRLFFMGMRRPGRALTIRDYDLLFKRVGRFLGDLQDEMPFHLGRALARLASMGGP